MRACPLCIAEKGFRGSDLVKGGPMDMTEDEKFAKHMETEHHRPVVREGETEQQCMERFKKQNPEAGGPNCKCPSCKAKRGDPRSAIVSALREPRV